METCIHCNQPIIKHTSKRAIECALAIIRKELYSPEYKNTSEYTRKICVNQEYSEYK